MSNYGRSPVPGEKGVQGILDQRAVLNRTIRAQVTSIGQEDGYVLLTYESMPSGGKFATVAPLWMSFPEATVGGPAWGRYMPQQSDLVKVSFDFDDRPHIVGFDIVAGQAGVADGESGWPEINAQYKIGNYGNDSKKAKFAQFTPLNPGEYDFMSSGGAYVYGNNRGQLYLAGGSVSITLTKNDLRISSRAQLWSHLADDCDLRFGQVRRVDSSDQLDKKVGDGKQKEFTVTLKKTEAAGQSTAVSTLKIGNVMDDSGNDENTPVAGDPMRFSYKAYTTAGEEALHMAIDNVGNWEMSAPNADKGINFDFTSGDWKVKTTNSIFTVSAKFQVFSPKVYLGGSTDDDQPFKLTDDGLVIGVNPTDMMALASLVKKEISALRDTVNSFVSTYNGHKHKVIGIQTAGSPVAHTQTAPVDTLAPLTDQATSPSAVQDVKSSFVKSL